MFNKQQQQALKQQGHPNPGTRTPDLQVIRVENFPQTTSNFPQTTCPASLKPRVISLKPRMDFPQTTSRLPPNHESISLKPRVRACKSAVEAVKRDLQGIPRRLRKLGGGGLAGYRAARAVNFPQTTSRASLGPRVSPFLPAKDQGHIWAVARLQRLCNPCVSHVCHQWGGGSRAKYRDASNWPVKGSRRSGAEETSCVRS